MIDDLILETKKNITLLKPRSADDVRKMKQPLVIFFRRNEPKYQRNQKFFNE